MNRRLRNLYVGLVLPGALALSIAGCTKGLSYHYHSKYNYKGNIEKDKVEFKAKVDASNILGQHDNRMTVTKPDGRVITYYDWWNNDLKLDGVKITKPDGQETMFEDNDVGKPVLEEAQKQFNSYLEQIKEIKSNQGLGDLK